LRCVRRDARITGGRASMTSRLPVGDSNHCVADWPTSPAIGVTRQKRGYGELDARRRDE
jgi:hypothetical protein